MNTNHTLHSHISSQFPSLALQEATKARITAVEGLRHDSHMHADIQKAGRYRLGVLLSKLSAGSSKLAVYDLGVGMKYCRVGLESCRFGSTARWWWSTAGRVRRTAGVQFFEGRRF